MRPPEGDGVCDKARVLEPGMLIADISVLGISRPSFERNAARQYIRLGGVVLFETANFIMKRPKGLLGNKRLNCPNSALCAHFGKKFDVNGVNASVANVL